MNIQIECHVDRVTSASENGKVEWLATVIEECLMLPTKPARTAKASALNFGGYLDTTQFSDSHEHPPGQGQARAWLPLGWSEHPPQQVRNVLGEVHPHAEG